MSLLPAFLQAQLDTRLHFYKLNLNLDFTLWFRKLSFLNRQFPKTFGPYRKVCIWIGRVRAFPDSPITVGMFKSSMLVLLLLAWSGYWAKKATEEGARKPKKGGEEEPGYGMTVLQEPVQVCELNVKALCCRPSCGRRLLSSARDRMIERCYTAASVSS